MSAARSLICLPLRHDRLGRTKYDAVEKYYSSRVLTAPQEIIFCCGYNVVGSFAQFIFSTQAISRLIIAGCIGALFSTLKSFVFYWNSTMLPNSEATSLTAAKLSM
jgi:hypothetical protein